MPEDTNSATRTELAARAAEHAGLDLQGIRDVVQAVLMGKIIGEAIQGVKAARVALSGAVLPTPPEKP